MAAVVLALVAVGASQVQAGGSQDSSVHELPPQWPEFKAAKVSFAQAGLEPLSAPELIQRLAGAQSIMNRSIVKSETHTTWWNDYRNSPHVRMRQYSGRMERNVEMEVRLDLDGRRCAVRELTWDTAGVLIQERESFKPNPAYFSFLWDGTHHYSYSFSESHPPGRVKIREGATFSENGMNRLGMELQMRGYYSAAARQIGAGGLQSVLLAARSVQLRGELEEIGGSACYVLDADTEYGRYVVWIDPAHGYNVARVEETRRKGDLYGAYRLPWSGNGRKTTIETIRFEQLDDVWVPTECEYRSESTSGNGHSKTLVRHKRTAVMLNPDFDALGSFVPDDIKEGARAECHTSPNGPFGDKEDWGVWKDGGVVPSAEAKALVSRMRVAGAGDVVADFTVKTLDGRRFRLSDHRGKVVLLHFWSSGSTSTVGLPGLKKWYDGLEDYREHFAMISLSLSRVDAPIRRQVEEYGLTWPQAQAREGDKTLATTAHGVLGIPAFIFIGPGRQDHPERREKRQDDP